MAKVIKYKLNSLLGGSLFHKLIVFFIMTWLIVFVLIPNLIMFVVSFLEYDQATFVRPEGTVQNYLKFFKGSYFYIFVNSFKIAAVSTLICLALAYPFSYILVRSTNRYKGLFALLVVIPYWTSALIRTYAISFVLSANGVVNNILMKLHIIDAPIGFLYTEGAIIVGFVYTLLPFMILPLYATIDKLDFRYVEAAHDLGASKLQTFLHVIFPLTMPGIVAGVVLVFLPALGLFYIPRLLGGDRIMMIGNVIYDQFNSNVIQNWPLGSAASMFITIVMALMIIVYYKTAKHFRTKVI